MAFTYTITDADGDTDTATLTLKITGDDNEPKIEVPEANDKDPAAGDAGTVVYEAGLSDGSAADGTNSTEGTITLTLNGEAATVTIGDTSFTVDSEGNAEIPSGGTVVTGTQYGTLTVTAISGGEVTYTYTIDEAQTHADGAGNNLLSETLGITVEDETHDTAAGTLKINIVDDVPTANDESVTLTELDAERGDATDGTNVLTNDVSRSK